MLKYIYLLTNKINKKRYVGQTIDLKMRFSKHFWISENTANIFQQEKRMYGKENFELTILEITDEENAFAREKYWIQELKTYLEYNTMLSSGTTKDEMEEIIEEFKNGKTQVELEKEKHLCRKTLTKALKEHEIDTKRNHKFRPLEEEKYLLAKEMYLNGNSIRAISEKMKICRKTLSKRFKEDNLLVIKQNDNRHKHPYQKPIAT